MSGISWKEVFGNVSPVEIEIGVGKGRFIQAAAMACPDRNFLGVEWANQFLRIGEERVAKKGLKNIRFLRVDAKEFITKSIPDHSVRAFYIFYPDPWPKKRHHKRRFFDRSSANDLAKCIQPGGELHIATDFEGYWQIIEPLFDSHPLFLRLEKFGGERFPVSLDEPLTNYEAKYLAQGRKTFRGSWAVR